MTHGRTCSSTPWHSRASNCSPPVRFTGRTRPRSSACSMKPRARSAVENSRTGFADRFWSGTESRSDSMQSRSGRRRFERGRPFTNSSGTSTTSNASSHASRAAEPTPAICGHSKPRSTWCPTSRGRWRASNRRNSEPSTGIWTRWSTSATESVAPSPRSRPSKSRRVASSNRATTTNWTTSAKPNARAKRG